jgi:hypothetical protein
VIGGLSSSRVAPRRAPGGACVAVAILFVKEQSQMGCFECNFGFGIRQACFDTLVSMSSMKNRLKPVFHRCAIL